MVFNRKDRLMKERLEWAKKMIAAHSEKKEPSFKEDGKTKKTLLAIRELALKKIW